MGPHAIAAEPNAPAMRRIGRVSSLDGLRALAVIAVVFFHAILNNDTSLIVRVLRQPLGAIVGWRDILTKLGLTLFDGEAALAIFFVLSGCVLRLSLDRRRDEAAWSLSLRFALARVLRFVPATAVCMVLFFAVSRLGIRGYPMFTVRNLWQNAILWKTEMHGPSLTLQQEMFGIPFLLIAFLLARRFGFVAYVLAAIYSVMAIELSWMTAGVPTMNVVLMPFMIGMLAADPLLRPAIASVRSGTWWVVLAGLLAMRAFQAPWAITGLVANYAIAALLIAGLLHGRHGSLAAFLNHPWLQTLGRISLSFYLFNVPVLDLIWSFTNAWPFAKTHALEVGLVVGPLSMILTWPLAWLSERWIERPSTAAGQWVWHVFREPKTPVVTMTAAAE